MIARRWHGRVPAAKAEDYLKLMKDVGLADYHFALAAVGGIPASDAMPRARELATRALQIDPDLPEAHGMLGIVAGHYDYDWAEAERQFRIAVKREPLSPHLRQWYATFWLASTGRGTPRRFARFCTASASAPAS